MRAVTAVLFALLVGACDDAVTPLGELDPSDAPELDTTCRVVDEAPIDVTSAMVDGFGTSVDGMLLTLLGEWKGNFEDTDGTYQPATLHLLPADGVAQRITRDSDAGPCAVQVAIPVALFLDVPCHIYGDINTFIVVSADASGVIESAKIEAPRNLLPRPDIDAMLLASGHFEEGVVDLALIWNSRGVETHAGRLSAALQ